MGPHEVNVFKLTVIELLSRLSWFLLKKEIIILYHVLYAVIVIIHHPFSLLFPKLSILSILLA